MEIGIKLEGMDELERRFRRAPQVFEGYMRRFMNRVLPLIEREVKTRMPVNTGAHRASVAHEIRGMGAGMQGIVGSPLPTMPFVELDTRPHWPPRGPIEYWVMRKFGLKGQALYLAARGVQCKIARFGTTGKHMFEEAFEVTADRVGRMWAETWGEAVMREL